MKREALRWSQIACKQAFDEVFVEYARSLKPGLLVGQWNHLGDFNQISGDERCMLPAELWSRDEDYLWYSTGGAAMYTDLRSGFLGDATLQARYIRGASGNKPFTLGKYESTRIRTAIAELAANGGAPMGFYTRFKDEKTREEIVRYYRFLEKNESLYRGNRPYAEVVLLYPRMGVHIENLAAVAEFKRIGLKMLGDPVLFDVLPDDLATEAARSAYRHVEELNKPSRYLDGVSRFNVPKHGISPTVRVSASRPKVGNEITLHFVNYNREEPKEKKSGGRGIQDEKPIAAEGVTVDFVLPKGATLARVTASSPEEPDAVVVRHALKDGRVQFTMPTFLVYAIARIEFKKE
jgi:hypothetical protein